MSRLFTPSRDIQFIQDIAKEIIKDVNGQKIYYFPVSTKTKVDEVYGEAPEKIFENPIILDAMVSNDEWTTKHGSFGGDYENTIDVWVSAKDLIDKGLFLSEGDFFTYGDITYEIVSYKALNAIHGQTEYDNDYKITGKNGRKSQVAVPLNQPTQDINVPWIDKTTVQKVFKQQQGNAMVDGQLTGDVRNLQETGKVERLGGPREVSPEGAGEYENKESSFYDE